MLMLDDAVLSEPEHLAAFKTLLRAGYIKPYQPAPVALPIPKRHSTASPKKPKKVSKVGFKRLSAMTGTDCDQCGGGNTPVPEGTQLDRFTKFTGPYGMKLCAGCYLIHERSIQKGLMRSDEITW